MSDLPRQPDIVPDQPTVPPPSLWLYLALIVVGMAMLGVALNSDAKLSDVLVNLGTGLLEAVAILIIIDRRLRQSEMATLRDLPRSVGVLLFLVWPAERQIYQYTRVFLARLQRAAKPVEPRPAFSQHGAKIDSGFVLLGKPGSGKTTWLQSVAIARAATFLREPKTHKAPILLPVRNWLPDRTLEQALLEHVAGFSGCSRRAFRRGMKNARFLIILDGADESWGLSPSLGQQVGELRKAYPGIPWTVSSRPDRPTPVDIEPVVNLSPPTPEEVAEFKARMNL